MMDETEMQRSLQLIKHLIFATAALASSVRVGATAVTVPPATYNAGVQSLASGGTFAYTAAGSYATGGASASIFVGPNPSVTADVGGNGAAYANMTYYFTVLGAPAGTIIPMDITVASLVATETNNASSQTGITVSAPDEGSASQYVQNNQTWSGILHQNYVVGDGYGELYLTVSAGVSQLTGTAYGYADPIISIDPSFLNTSGYTVSVSQGVGNSQASTPEPSTLALFGGGFIALLYRLRNQPKR
jgi:hypothetical protein